MTTDAGPTQPDEASTEAPVADAAPVAEQPPAEPAEAAPGPAEQPGPDGPDPAQHDETPAAPEGRAAKPAPKRKRQRSRRPAVPNLPKTRAPLPIDELRDASRSTLELFGPQQAVRDSFSVLGAKERQDISALIAQDEDHRPRARNIANGSLGAGRIDKAMAATILSMVRQEDLWAATLDKELAAQKLGRIREAKQRDKQRADRAKERANRSDRVSREDLKAAQDGRVGATIRFVTDDEPRERRKKPEAPKKPAKSGVLDKLGY
ncbi:MAG TPA: hypothetical protein VII98_05025 [Solirubrobacteraceae bacterium]